MVTTKYIEFGGVIMTKYFKWFCFSGTFSTNSGQQAATLNLTRGLEYFNITSMWYWRLLWWLI